MSLRHLFSKPKQVDITKAPEFAAQGWDDSRSKLWSGYAYALNLPEIGNAQPGALNSRLRGVFNEIHPLMDRLETDGHAVVSRRFIDVESFDPALEYIVAAFHFNTDTIKGEAVLLRLNADRTWSWKPEGQVPRNIDLAGNRIMNPATARIFRSTLPAQTTNLNAFEGYVRVGPELLYAPRMNVPDPKVFEIKLPSEVHIPSGNS